MVVNVNVGVGVTVVDNGIGVEEETTLIGSSFLPSGTELHMCQNSIIYLAYGTLCCEGFQVIYAV